jgi:hypothetical protein
MMPAGKIIGYTDVIALLPSPASTKSKTYVCGPCASLEEQDREDDSERQTKAGADQEGGKTAVPLLANNTLANYLQAEMAGRK